MSTTSLAGCLKPACSSIRTAFAVSPDANCESRIWTWPAMLPTAMAATAKISQPNSAFFQLSALHLPARPARLSPLIVVPP